MVNSKSMHWWIILQSVITFLTISSKGESVDLTIEGGVSLVGPHCPDVRLLCEGVELTSIRWRYNGNMNIISYFPDGTRTTQSATSAFFMPQLITVERNQINLNFANFSSSLTVNVSQLITNNVAEISCGAPGVSQVEPVNVSIIEPGVPNNPIITLVSAAYQSGELNSLEVTWEKSDNFCPSYGIVFTYEVNITTFDSVLVNHSSTNCGEVLCMVSFKNLTGETKDYVITIKAENEIGSSDLVLYPFLNAHQIQQYFISDVFLKDRQLFGRCTAARTFAGSVVCIVQYTTDSMYRGLSNKTIQPLNTEFLILKDPVLETIYYFQFSVLVNSTLQITERIVFKYSTQAGIPSLEIALIVIAVIIVLVLALLIIIAILFLRNRQVKEKGEGSNLMEKVKTLTVSVEGSEIKKVVTGSGIFKSTKYYTAHKIVVNHGYKTHIFFKTNDELEEMYNKVKIWHSSKPEESEFPPKPSKDNTNFAKELIDNLMKISSTLQECPPFKKFLELDTLNEKPKKDKNTATEQQQKTGDQQAATGRKNEQYEYSHL